MGPDGSEGRSRGSFGYPAKGNSGEPQQRARRALRPGCAKQRLKDHISDPERARQGLQKKPRRERREAFRSKPNTIAIAAHSRRSRPPPSRGNSSRPTGEKRAGQGGRLLAGPRVSLRPRFHGVSESERNEDRGPAKESRAQRAQNTQEKSPRLRRDFLLWTPDTAPLGFASLRRSGDGEKPNLGAT